jgi:putative hydrolase of the HAD superfamily
MIIPPSLVLFDVDDTLCDYAAARRHRLRIALGAALGERAEIDLDAVIAESIAMHPHGSEHFGDLLAAYGVSDHAAVAEARRWYGTNRFLGLELFPDALAALTLARDIAAGRAVGLITNGPAEVQRAKVELLGLEAHVDFVLISGEFGVAKPDPAIFAEALRLAGRAPHEAIYIGDSPEFDIAGARNAGIRSVWVNRAGDPWSWPEPPPDHIARSLSDLAALLGSDLSGQ